MKAFVDDVLFLSEVLAAASMRERMVGLLGRDGLEKGTGMLIEQCGSIHTFFMKFDLDVIFLDSSDRVLKVCKSVTSGRTVLGGFGAKRVLEMEAGSASVNAVQVGSQIQFKD